MAVLQRLIEKSTKEIYQSKLELRRSHKFLEEVHRAIPGALVVFDEAQEILSVSASTCRLLGYDESELLGQKMSTILNRDADLDPAALDEQGVGVFQSEVNFKSKRGEQVPVWLSASTGPRVGALTTWYMVIGQDIRERKKLEVQLRHTQKLESIGQLAAGIAHEINTPIQFVNDSIDFLKESFDDMLQLQAAYLRAIEAAAESSPELRQAIADADEEADFAFIAKEAPLALDRCVDGLTRVSSIVKSLKTFSHPGAKGKVPSNLASGIQDTLVIAASEYKLVAKVETDLADDVTAVACRLSDINQVVLNLVVNAAHAIADQRKALDQRELGLICVSARKVGENVEVRVSDSGGGIPESVQERIFDPFFTTKEVGQGTGQGLSLAHEVMEQHDGTVRFETGPSGTTFILEWPG